VDGRSSPRCFRGPTPNSRRRRSRTAARDPARRSRSSGGRRSER
jgi:hypothetical protein